MKRFISVLFCIACLTASAVDVQWIFSDFTGTTTTNKRVYITPLTIPGVSGTNIIQGDRRTYTNDATGSLIVSNLVPGASYRVEFVGAYITTTITNTFATNATGFVNGKDYLSTTLATAGDAVAYSQTAADARFAAKTNTALYGTVKLAPAATLNYVWTATNSNGAGYWVAASAGAATNVVWPVAGTNVTMQTNGLAVTVNATTGSSQTEWPVSAITNSGTATYSNATAFALGSHDQPLSTITNAGTAAYSNSTAFALSSHDQPLSTVTNAGTAAYSNATAFALSSHDQALATITNAGTAGYSNAAAFLTPAQIGTAAYSNANAFDASGTAQTATNDLLTTATGRINASTNGLPRGVTGSGSATATTNENGVVNIEVVGTGGDVTTAQLQSATNVATLAAMGITTNAFALKSAEDATNAIDFRWLTNKLSFIPATNGAAGDVTTAMLQSATNVATLASMGLTTNDFVTALTNTLWNDSKAYAEQRTNIASMAAMGFATNGYVNTQKTDATNGLYGALGNLANSNAATARIDMATNAVNATNLFNANLPVPTNTPSAGQVPVATSASSAAWQVQIGANGFSSTGGEVWEDFTFNSTASARIGILGLYFGVSGGAIASAAGEVNHPGIVAFSTSTSATGSAFARSDITSFDLSSGSHTNEWLVRITTLSDDTENFIARCGFADGSQAAPTDGACFIYNHSTNSGAWTAMVAGASSATYASTGLNASAGTWVKLRVGVSGGTAYFFTNGVLATSITGANVPAAGEVTGIACGITKYAGTTARTEDLDYTYLGYSITR